MRRRVSAIVLSIILSVSMAMPTFADEVVMGDTVEMEDLLVETDESNQIDDSIVEEQVVEDATEDQETVVDIIEDANDEATDVIEEDPIAEDTAVEDENAIEEPVLEEDILGEEGASSGKAGVYTTYVINGSTMTISGSGAIEGFNPQLSNEEKSKITKVVINEGVISIDAKIFDAWKSLQTVDMPSSLKRIETCAFRNCTALENVNFSEGLIYIGTWAFQNASSLTNINIPSTCTTLDEHAFTDCISLKEVIINEGLSAIKYKCFFQCASLEHIVLPKTVTSIGSDAFYKCEKLKTLGPIGGDYNVETFNVFSHSPFRYLSKVDVPSTDVCIPEKAFDGCSYLETVVVPGNIKRIETCAFRDCTSLSSISLSEGLVYVGTWAFQNCSSLPSISTPSTLTTLDEHAFYDCINLKEVTISEGLQQIKYRCFYQCGSLEHINFPKTVTYIGSDAFYKCEKLKTLGALGSGCNIETYYIYSNAPFYYVNKVTVPNTEVNIPEKAFDGCKYLESIEFSSKIKKIGNCAFRNCTSLKSVSLKEGLVYIGTWSFQNCNVLESITVPSTCKDIDEHAFDGCYSLRNVTLRNGVKSLKYRAFYGCSSLQSITIPDSVTYIGYDVFGGCSSRFIITASVKSTGAKYAKDNNIKLVTVCFVNFKNNGGYGYMKPVKTKIKGNARLSSVSFDRPGYKFTGWNTDKNGRGKAYKNKATLRKLTKSVNLYAQWKPNTYKVKYNGNGATSGKMGVQTGFTYGKSKKLNGNKFSKKGYVFVGWNTNKDGSGITYKNASNVKNLTTRNGDTVILYAQWKKK